jgi:carbamoyltransferase
MRILGLHPFGHDSTIVLLDDVRKTVEALTLERFTRKKHDMNYIVPHFTKKILSFDPDVVAVSNLESRAEDIQMFERLQRIYELNAKARKSSLKKFEVVELYRNKIGLRANILKRKLGNELGFVEKIGKDTGIKTVTCRDHHSCHGYSALWTSELAYEKDVLVVTIDGQGDAACATLSIADQGVISRQVTISNAFSLCILFSYFTEVAGFNPNADEGKLEALACYYEGKESKLLTALQDWIQFDENTLEFSLKPNQYIPFNAIPQNRRRILSWLRQIYQSMDPKEFAYAMQILFEEKYLAWIIAAKKKFGSKSICMSGGGIANVKLNLRIFEEAGFEKIHIIPAMGDDGVAMGAAIITALENKVDLSFLAKVQMPFWGIEATKDEVEKTIEKAKSQGFQVSGPYEIDQLASIIGAKLGDNKICSVFRGRAEYGPRALGHRSILANPTDPGARDAINNKFKRREWFQPFCPIIADFEAERILTKFYRNKHMTCAFRVKEQFAKSIPSVVHVDNTARAEILDEEDEPFIYKVLLELKKISGFGVLLNTSFNLHGRSIVNTPDHALADFTDCGLDFLVLEDYLIARA